MIVLATKGFGFSLLIIAFLVGARKFATDYVLVASEVCQTALSQEIS